MKRLLLSLIVMLVAIGVFAPTATRAYANTPQLDPSVNSRIIDDSVFLNKSTMSAADIQSFLNAKVPVCDTNHQGGLSQYPPPYICLKDYVDPNTGKKAAQLIYDEAQSRGINPQVLLVTLQKEQSLVTDPWPYPSQYRSAMGYGCPESQTTCDAEYYGFYNQVHLGSGLLRADTARSCGDTSTLPGYSDIPTELKLGRTTDPNGPNHRIDGVATYIGSCATGALYVYTPHRPDSAYTLRNGTYYYGNYNFINYFTSWFGSTNGSPLYKTPTSGLIYAVVGGVKYLIPDFPTMVAYGFHRLPVNNVDQSTIDAFAVDPDPVNRTLTTIAHKNGDPNGTTYLFDDGKRYSLPGSACSKNIDNSPNPDTTWGIDCFNTNVNKTLPGDFFDRYTVLDGPIPPMMANGETVYKMEGGKKRPIINGIFIDVLGGWGKVRWMKDNNATQPLGQLIALGNQIFTFGETGAVYLYDNNKLSLVPNIDVYFAWGFPKRKAVHLPASYNNGATALPTAPSLTPFASDSTSTYLIDFGFKKSLAGQVSNWPVGTPIFDAPQALASLPAQSLKPVLSSPGGTIHTVFGGKKYIFPTFDDFFGLGFSLDMVGQVSLFTEGLFASSFGGFHLAPGRLVKVVGSDVIYMINGGARLTVPSPDYFGYLRLPADKTITIESISAARYPVAATAPLVFKAPDGSVYVANGTRLRADGAMQSAYGINASGLTTYSQTIIDRLTDGGSLTQFAKISNGQIFHISSGQRHYVTTIEKLNSLGAHAGNIRNLPDQVVLAIPDGGSI